MGRHRLIGAVTNAIRRARDRFRGSHTSGAEERVPAPDSAIAFEWGGDLESFTFRGNNWDGSPYEATGKARCARCWGGLVARHDDRHQVTGIKCRVCGEKLEGDAAREEYSRMFNEHATNLGNVSSGRLPCYADDAIFVLKTFPVRERMSPDDIHARIGCSKAARSTRNTIDRNDFPPGSPGYFVLQATVLMASVEDITHPHARSVMDFPDICFRDDRTTVWTISHGRHRR